jgi:diguanylate cyclase (GGDEF)-like protein
MKENIQSLSGRHIVPIMVVAAIGLFASVVAWYYTVRAEDRTLTQEFNSRAGNQALVLQNGINDYIDKLYAVQAYFNAFGDRISRDEFEIVSRSLLRGHPAILNVAWAPLVKRGQRIAHEQKARNDGITNYHIQTASPDRGLHPSPERDEYLPKFYSTEARTSPVYGIELLHGEPQQPVVERARDNDAPATSPPFVLQIGIGDRHGFFIVLPVYARGLPHRTEDSRRRNFRGVVQGVFQTGVMFDSILANITTPVRLYFFAPDAAKSELSLYSTSRVSHEPVAAASQETLATGLNYSFPIAIGDAQWTLVAVPQSSGLVSADHSRSWLLLISGLLLTGAASAQTWSSRRYAHKLELANQRISDLALTDAVTGLANRRAFIDRLIQAFDAAKRGSSPFAVLYFDLDCFKTVNDTLGHPVGDLLLRQVAQRTQKAVRKTDVAARFGGDEFAVLQANAADIKAVTALAGKLIRALGTPYAIDGNDIHISASIGISLYSADHKDPESMMMESDIALYRAKNDGRNCYRFHNENTDMQALEKVAVSGD